MIVGIRLPVRPNANVATAVIIFANVIKEGKDGAPKTFSFGEIDESKGDDGFPRQFAIFNRQLKPFVPF